MQTAQRTYTLNDVKRIGQFGWPGGYQIIWFDSDYAPLCYDCAIKWQEYSTDLIAFDANWEDEYLYCGNCGKHLRSEYGNDQDD